MKKSLLFIITSILLVSILGFTIAAPENGTQGENAQAVVTAMPYGAGSQGANASENGNQGEYPGAGNGDMIGIENGTQERNQERIMAGDDFSSNGVKARTTLELMNEGEGSEMKVQLSNGRNAEVKVMPDVASETALQRLKLKTCAEENGCTIELKEVGKGDNTAVAYEVKTQRQSKVFGLFKADMDVQAQVDAETGELLKVKKPWWAFLASEPQEE